MPWTDDDHAAATAATYAALAARQDAGHDVDLDPRVVDSMALENTGTTGSPPVTGATGRILDRKNDRALRSGAYGRWATIVWRARLARTVADSRVRRAAFADPDPFPRLEAAGLADRKTAEAAAQAVRTGNRADRRAAQKRARRAR